MFEGIKSFFGLSGSAPVAIEQTKAEPKNVPVPDKKTNPQSLREHERHFPIFKRPEDDEDHIDKLMEKLGSDPELRSSFKRLVTMMAEKRQGK